MIVETCQERAARECVAAGAPAANFNRASAGYCNETLLGMLTGLDASEGFYTACGRCSGATMIMHRRNDEVEHEARIVAAAGRLRKAYGLRVRLSRHHGKVDWLTVYGPKSGGHEGRYSS